MRSWSTFKQSVKWEEISSKPSTYPPTVHSHAIGDTTNLQISLNNKSNLLGGNSFSGNQIFFQNIGINTVIPSWNDVWRVIQIMPVSFVGSTDNDFAAFNSNMYTSTTNFFGGAKYINNGFSAASYVQNAGNHYFYNSMGSGQANSPITFIESFSIFRNQAIFNVGLVLNSIPSNPIGLPSGHIWRDANGFLKIV